MGGAGYCDLKERSKESNGYTFVLDSNMSTVSQAPQLTRIKNEKSFLF